MGKTLIAPYIFFKGNAREAMEFYKGIFGGELSIQTMGEVPEEVRQQAGNPDKANVMHAKLETGDIILYASDSAKASDKAAKISLSIMGDDEAKLRQIFDNLSQGGSVFMPLSKQFWGDTFGSLTDMYGVEWMVNISSGETPN